MSKESKKYLILQEKIREKSAKEDIYLKRLKLPENKRLVNRDIGDKPIYINEKMMHLFQFIVFLPFLYFIFLYDFSNNFFFGYSFFKYGLMLFMIIPIYLVLLVKPIMIIINKYRIKFKDRNYILKNIEYKKKYHKNLAILKNKVYTGEYTELRNEIKLISFRKLDKSELAEQSIELVFEKDILYSIEEIDDFVIPYLDEEAKDKYIKRSKLIKINNRKALSAINHDVDNELIIDKKVFLEQE